MRQENNFGYFKVSMGLSLCLKLNSTVTKEEKKETKAG